MTNLQGNVWQGEGRINNQILGVKRVKTWVLVQPGAWTLYLLHSSLALYNMGWPFETSFQVFNIKKNKNVMLVTVYTRPSAWLFSTLFYAFPIVVMEEVSSTIKSQEHLQLVIISYILMTSDVWFTCYIWWENKMLVCDSQELGRRLVHRVAISNCPQPPF